MRTDQTEKSLKRDQSMETSCSWQERNATPADLHPFQSIQCANTHYTTLLPITNTCKNPLKSSYTSPHIKLLKERTLCYLIAFDQLVIDTKLKVTT